MRILLGTLLGYSLRQRERLLITILTFVLITIYIALPTLSLAIQAIALTHLGLSGSTANDWPDQNKQEFPQSKVWIINLL